MPDLTLPLIAAGLFVGGGWIVTHAAPHDADAIRHTLSVFALAMGMLVLGGVMAKLHARLGVGRMMHRIEAASQAEPAAAARPPRSRMTSGAATAGSPPAPSKAVR